MTRAMLCQSRVKSRFTVAVASAIAIHVAAFSFAFERRVISIERDHDPAKIRDVLAHGQFPVHLRAGERLEL